MCFDKFYKITNNIADKHAPFRQVTKKEQSLQLKPWITKEIRHLIWERDKLFSKYCRAKDIRKKFELHEKFKRYRNEIVFKIRNSKKIYFQSFFEKNKNDSKKIWKGIRSLVTLKKKNLTQPTSLSVNGELLTNPIKVSNVFNKYFVNIGPNLSNQISNDAPDFHSFLKNKPLNSFILKREVHTFSLFKYVNVLKKIERTKKTAGQKLFSFSHNGPPKLAILSNICDDVTGCKRPFSLYISYIKH